MESYEEDLKIMYANEHNQSVVDEFIVSGITSMSEFESLVEAIEEDYKNHSDEMFNKEMFIDTKEILKLIVDSIKRDLK